MLLNGLKLFIADIEEENTNNHTLWYVVGKSYDSAFKRFVKEANKTWDRCLYYFGEADEDIVRSFMEHHTEEDIKADIYE